VICCMLQGEDLRAKRKARHPRPMSCRCLCQSGFVLQLPRSLDGHLSGWKKHTAKGADAHFGNARALAVKEQA